jgi:hypothetical protein
MEPILTPNADGLLVYGNICEDWFMSAPYSCSVFLTHPS